MVSPHLHSENGFLIVPLANGPGLRTAVRRAVFAHLDADFFVICEGHPEDAAEVGAVSAAEVAGLLESFGATSASAPLAALRYGRDTLRMLAFYGDVPVPPFAVIDPRQRALTSTGLASLKGPLLVQSVDSVGRGGTAVASPSELPAVLEAALALGPTVVSEDPVAAGGYRRELAVVYSMAKDSATNGYSGPDADFTVMNPNPRTDKVAVAAARAILGAKSTGMISLELLVPVAADDGQPVLLGEAIVGATLASLGWWLDHGTIHRQIWLLCEAARRAAAIARPKHLVTFDAATKGFHLRAACNIAAGDVVFYDEGRTFALVTREHVRATWSEPEQVVFSRYAWPVDSDGHVYAIWEEEPKRWRPINHSCDPSCVFAAPHSLNVVATRAIAAGEDLTIDYATFCDYTMKPFQCHCGTSHCRGLIKPDAASLAKYGKSAWHRRQPAEM